MAVVAVVAEVAVGKTTVVVVVEMAEGKTHRSCMGQSHYRA